MLHFIPFNKNIFGPAHQAVGPAHQAVGPAHQAVGPAHQAVGVSHRGQVRKEAAEPRFLLQSLQEAGKRIFTTIIHAV